jgi:UDP-apiose/xylose synthase
MTGIDKRVLVIGCGGFIGSHLIEQISSRYSWPISGWDIDLTKLTDLEAVRRATMFQGDYARPENQAKLREDIDSADVVINLAAICTPAQYNTNPLKVIKSNFIDAYKLIDMCADQGKWLVHFSTSEVYGRTISSYVEGDNYSNPALYELNEDTTPLVMGPVVRQRWTYACAKQLLERYVYAHHHENKLPFTIVRPLNFFGPRMDFIPGADGEGVPRVLACFMEALMKRRPLKLVDGGRARRTILAIEDAIEAVIAILCQPQNAVGHAFNLGNPSNEVSIAELAESMRSLFSVISGTKLDDLPPIVNVTATDFYGNGYEDCDRRMPSIEKAKRLLGWSPRVNLEETLRRSITYYWRRYGSAMKG